MTDGSEFQTAILKPREAKVIRTRGTGNRLVFTELRKLVLILSVFMPFNVLLFHVTAPACGCSRIFEILPVRIKDWQSSPCIADERSRAALEAIRRQQLLARKKLLGLDRRRRDLDTLIDRAKHLTVQPELDVSHSTVCMSLCLSLCLSICLCVCQLIRLQVDLRKSVSVSVRPPVHLSVHPQKVFLV